MDPARARVDRERRGQVVQQEALAVGGENKAKADIADAEALLAIKRAEALKKGDFNKAQEIVQDDGEKVWKAKVMRSLTGTMADLSTEARQVESSRTLSAKEKRERLDDINARRRQVAESVR